VNRAIADRHSDKSLDCRFIDGRRGGVPRFVILLHLNQALDGVCKFVIVNDLMVDVAEQNQIVEAVSLFV
jgi:hypothetical protein